MLDPMCISKELKATITVLGNNTTDHYPLLASVMIDLACPSNRPIDRRNFKKVTPSALNRALKSWNWSDVFKIDHPDDILSFINEGIVHSMDLVWPRSRGSLSRMARSSCTSGPTPWISGTCLVVAPSTSKSKTE